MNATLTSLYRHPLLTASDLELIAAAHKSVSLKKRDFILKKGHVANAYFCVEEGMIRSYVYDYAGNDITTGFIGKDELAIDVVSLFTRVPSEEYFQALTDCKCQMIDLDAFQQLYHSIKGLNEWGRAWMSESLFALKQRTISMITDSATERYARLEAQHPQILQQAPLKYIASYLGITDSSLSRIRKERCKSL